MDAIRRNEKKKRYLVSGDMYVLMRRWAQQTGFTLPQAGMFASLQRQLLANLDAAFNCEVEIRLLTWGMIKTALIRLIEEKRREEGLDVLFISLDTVYVENPDIVFNSTRIEHYSKHTSGCPWKEVGCGYRPGHETIKRQLDRIVRHSAFSGKKDKRVIVVDDGVWSGKSFYFLEQALAHLKIKVIAFVVGVKIDNDTNADLPVNKLLAPVVALEELRFPRETIIDWVCERDFFPGVLFSGRTLGEEQVANGDFINSLYKGVPMEENYGAPYVAPFGDPEHWANIPSAKVLEFSRACLKMTQAMYRAIERETKRATQVNRPVLVRDLHRKPYELRKKLDNRIVDELDISISMLK